MKSFVLDARTAIHHFPGIGRYIFNLTRAMIPQLRSPEKLVLLCNPSEPAHWDLRRLAGPQVEMIDIAVSPFSLQQQWQIPALLKKLNAAMYHSPYYLMPYWVGVPTLVTIHDLIPMRYPHYFARVQRLIFSVAIRLAVRRSQRIIAVSQATSNDLEQLLKVPKNRINVIFEAADSGFKPTSSIRITALRDRLNLPEQYVLYLGSNKPHKNLVRLVEAWAQMQPPSYKLVIAGVWDSRYPEVKKLADTLGVSESVYFLGPLPESDLPALYSGAAIFVFPSEYEGFGLPVLEAMACGTPVACANSSSLPEIAGDAALTFTPTKIDDAIMVLGRLLADDVLRANLKERGVQQAVRFSWQHTALATLEIYREILSC